MSDMTEGEERYVTAVWSHMPGATCWMDAFLRILQGRVAKPRAFKVSPLEGPCPVCDARPVYSWNADRLVGAVVACADCVDSAVHAALALQDKDSREG